MVLDQRYASQAMRPRTVSADNDAFIKHFEGRGAMGQTFAHMFKRGYLIVQNEVIGTEAGVVHLWRTQAGKVLVLFEKREGRRRQFIAWKEHQGQFDDWVRHYREDLARRQGGDGHRHRKLA